ncbi:helix-turn-helix domain-containing protein [Diaminobutyricibacter tongyongensis]|uniref:Helix-turn-helix domain-containing protein n=1 Tax=Leifsonia tongyongensis TaxID=1268043 RepID=A0A6L9XY14_9MICO|nr:helix-turn-helix domain-containing protein [Diaminobutyricibacter tongyongensis]NEN06332.1 helix-turn-helix domain-containing protein [Diaminobutyricibacter tongyongensis]
MPSPDWCTIQAAAEHLAVSTKTVRRLISDGKLSAERIGPRLIRVSIASLEHVGRPLQYVAPDASDV